MKLVDNVSKMSTLSGMYRKEGRSIGFVPTMGYLHEGHLSLARGARKHNDVVVMSIFVNPTQFGPGEDFERYPRDLKRDEALAAGSGVDVLFCPSAEEMYPAGYATYVNVEGLSEAMCGSSRPGHFKGVATVVAKLFGIVRPDAAYFGQKDAQQVAVISKMAQDLNMGVEIKAMPIVREADGLAMSSRNVHLSERERRDAAVISRSLREAEELFAGGERDSANIADAVRRAISGVPSARVDYVSVVDPDDLKGIVKIEKDALVAVAAWIGKTRLIDNTVLKISGKGR